MARMQSCETGYGILSTQCDNDRACLVLQMADWKYPGNSTGSLLGANV